MVVLFQVRASNGDGDGAFSLTYRVYITVTVQKPTGKVEFVVMCSSTCMHIIT